MTRILRYIILITIWATLLFGGILSWYAWSLPNPEELTTSLRRPSVTVIGADGSVLAAYGDLPESSLAQAEQLEQLRALQAGWEIDVLVTDWVGRGVDTPEDLAHLSRSWKAPE